MNAIALILLALSTLWTVAGLGTVVHAARCAARQRAPRRRSEPEQSQALATTPAVSVLKPLCGVDAELESNLESFFLQDYPSFELLFGVEDPCDPAIAVVNRLRHRHPNVPCRLVVHQGGRATNPKVRNLLGILPAASRDLLLLSDSNIRVPRHYVREMVEVMQAEPRVGLVTSLIAGQGESTLGGALESVQLDGFCAAGATLPTSLGDAAVIGKSMLFARSTFERLGGFARVADVLAEDYVMGKMFELGGLRVALASTVVDNVTTGMSFGAFLRRHLRWSMLRIRLRPFTFLLEPITCPLALLPVAVLGLGAWGIAWVVGLTWLRDVGGWLALRGAARAWIPLGLGPLRDLCMLGVWLYTPIEQHVCWRGHRARLGAGTLLFPRVA